VPQGHLIDNYGTNRLEINRFSVLAGTIPADSGLDASSIFLKDWVGGIFLQAGDFLLAKVRYDSSRSQS
jgi:hypothetical protein